MEAVSTIMIVEATVFSETSVTSYRRARRHIPKDIDFVFITAY